MPTYMAYTKVICGSKIIGWNFLDKTALHIFSLLLAPWLATLLACAFLFLFFKKKANPAFIESQARSFSFLLVSCSTHLLYYTDSVNNCRNEFMLVVGCMKVKLHFLSKLPFFLLLLLLLMMLFMWETHSILFNWRYTLFWILLLCSKFSFSYFVQVSSTLDTSQRCFDEMDLKLILIYR